MLLILFTIVFQVFCTPQSVSTTSKYNRYDRYNGYNDYNNGDNSYNGISGYNNRYLGYNSGYNNAYQNGYIGSGYSNSYSSINRLDRPYAYNRGNQNNYFIFNGFNIIFNYFYIFPALEYFS